jgi:AcrR family transcriptional regulator
MKKKIVDLIFRLEAQKGHLKWTVSQIALSAKVSRSLIYYHFGKTKIEILLNCLEMTGNEFYGLSPARRSLSLVDSLELTFLLYKSNPSYAIFFHKWRNVPSPIQDKYLDFEKRYDKKLRDVFPKASSAQRLAIQAFFHGLVTAPYADRKVIEEAVLLLHLEELRVPR